MKILLINDHHNYGGAENYVQALEEQLSKEHEVKVLTLDGSEEADYTVEENNSAISKIRNRYFFNRKTKKEIRGYIEKFDPDVVHLNKNIVAPVPVLKALKREEVIKTVHDFGFVSLDDKYAYEMNSWERRIRKFLDTATQRYLKKLRAKIIDAYTAPSQALAEEMGKKEYQNIQHLPNFVTDRETSFGGEHFLFVGRLEEGKAPDLLVEAYRQASGDIPPLEMAGEGKMKEYLEEKSSELENVTVRGYVSDEKLEELYKNSKAVVIPSRWRENNPLVALEAKAYGSALLVSDQGGLPELVEKDKTGFIFESENAGNLKKNLSREVDWIELGENSREDYEDNYRPEVHVQKLLEIYNEVGAT